jgi:hypothetical protein
MKLLKNFRQRGKPDYSEELRLSEIFPYFCIDWYVITTLFSGRLYEKIMGWSLFLIFATLINPMTLVGIELLYDGVYGTVGAPGTLRGVWRLLFIFSVALIAMVSIIFRAAFIPFLVYLAVVKGFFHIVGRTDALMSVVFAFFFFAMFIVNKFDKSKSESPREREGFISVVDENIVHDDQRMTVPILTNPPKEPLCELEERFVPLSELKDNATEVFDMVAVQTKRSFGNRLKNSFSDNTDENEGFVFVSDKEVERSGVRKLPPIADRFDDFRDERFK